jgi:hypothetical protein
VVRLCFTAVALLLLFSPLAWARGEAGLFIESRVEPQRPYLQQQVVYTLRLYRKSHLQRGYFNPPEVPGAILRPLESPQPEKVRRGDETYELLEQKYLLFPQRSGPMELPAPIFSSRDLYIQGEPLVLDVRPRPASAPGNEWLVAKELVLKQSWSGVEGTLGAGGHIERVVSLAGRGVIGAQLPGIKPEPVEGMRVQLLKEQVSEQIEDGEVTGRRVVHLLYVPLAGGEYQIPPLGLHWWRSGDESWQEARLPGKGLTVEEQAVQSQAEPGIAAAVERPVPVVQGGAKAMLERFGLPLGVLLLLLLSALLLRLGFWALLRRPAFALFTLFRLLAACMSRSPGRMSCALLAWAGRNGWSERPLTLISLADSCQDPLLGSVLRDLDSALYSRVSAGWKPDYPFSVCLQLVKKLGGRPPERRPSALPGLWEG